MTVNDFPNGAEILAYAHKTENMHSVVHTTACSFQYVELRIPC